MSAVVVSMTQSMREFSYPQTVTRENRCVAMPTNICFLIMQIRRAQFLSAKRHFRVVR